MSGQEDADETVSRKGLFVFEEIYAFSTSADVRIDASASFRSAGLHMIALACSNNELVILQCYRNSTWQRTPYKWCHDPMRTITCLVFSPCGQYLICLLISGCLEVIPIHLITAAKYCKSAQEIDEELFDQNDLTYIPIQVRDDCLSQPTCALWYQTRSNKPVLVYGNKGGDIVFFDLCLRRLTVSLQAPQSIHNIELFTSDCIDVYLLVTGFAGSQWLIPLEKDGSTLRETLGSVIPSMLKELSVKSRVFSVPFGECSSFAISSGCSLQSSAMREKFTFYCGNMDMESGFVGFASTANDDDDNESPLVSLPSCIVITSSSVFKVHCRW
ncbi:unnamed protein product [Soboliphyme baturini]|uniref:Transducin/WD40 repeat-like superfamily protein n=1 Tax=Soboliphyme baturini TaxID=241478 RepID=A0A183IVF8_9BILA|nr:unnamed protein product [Soboliphyme baturini]